MSHRRGPVFKKSYRPKRRQPLNKRVAKLEKTQRQKEKGVDTELNNDSVGTTPTVHDVGTVAQGDDRENRKGDEIRIKSVFGRFLIYQSASAASTQTDFIRIMVLFDNQANGAKPAYTDVVENNNVMAYRTMGKSTRFHVIYNKLITLDPSNRSKIVSFYKKNLNQLVQYTGSSGAITDISKGSLILIAWSNQASLTPTINSNIRFRFTD